MTYEDVLLPRAGWVTTEQWAQVKADYISLVTAERERYGRTGFEFNRLVGVQSFKPAMNEATALRVRVHWICQRGTGGTEGRMYTTIIAEKSKSFTPYVRLGIHMPRNASDRVIANKATKLLSAARTAFEASMRRHITDKEEEEEEATL